MENESDGRALQAGDDEARSEAARRLGSARTERKAAAARENGKKAKLTPEQVLNHKRSQEKRRERERLEKANAPLVNNANMG